MLRALVITAACSAPLLFLAALYACDYRASRRQPPERETAETGPEDMRLAA